MASSFGGRRFARSGGRFFSGAGQYDANFPRAQNNKNPTLSDMYNRAQQNFASPMTMSQGMQPSNQMLLGAPMNNYTVNQSNQSLLSQANPGNFDNFMQAYRGRANEDFQRGIPDILSQFAPGDTGGSSAAASALANSYRGYQNDILLHGLNYQAQKDDIALRAQELIRRSAIADNGIMPSLGNILGSLFGAIGGPMAGAAGSFLTKRFFG